MDQRTLVVSCVEYYSDLKNIPSNKVFISFQQSGFIDLILDSHKTFPEMDIDFFVGMIDGLTYLESDAGEQEKDIHAAKADTLEISLNVYAYLVVDCCRKSTK